LIRFLKNIAHQLRGLALKAMLCLMAMFFSSASGTSDADEYSIKAMFILNFMKYVEWPVDETKNVFQIGIAGESEIYDALISLSTQRTGDGKKIEIKKVDPDALITYKILFIPRAQNKSTAKWLNYCQGKGVLIITEDCKNSQKGAAINLLNIDNKIRFEIYQTAAKLGGVKISSRLSELATTIHQ
jgi:hypothetical protein